MAFVQPRRPETADWALHQLRVGCYIGMSYASWTTSHASQRGGTQDAFRTRQDTPGCTREDLPGKALTIAPTCRALSPYGCS
eukprot:3735-Chlamydomonas_euryale.AAC.1